jgi:PAS domain S-box-containing protein
MYTRQNFEAVAVFEHSSDISPLVPYPQRDPAQDRTADIPEESETSYRYLFEANPQPMWIYDFETLRFLLVNDAAVRHYGYSPDEFLAMTIKDICPEEDIPLLLKATMVRPQKNGKCGVWRHRKKDREIIDVEVTVHDFRFQGKTARLSLINDITEHKRIERALQQSELEQRQLAEHLEMERERLAEAQALAKVGSWDLNLTTNVLFWSKETYRIFGMDRTSFGASYEAFLERVYPDDRAAVNKAYTESVANRTPYAVDHRMQMPDGAIKIVHERCHTIYDSKGRPVRSLGTVQDITEQKQTEQKLTRSLDLLRAVIEGTTDAVFAKDRQGHYLMINSSGARLVGKTQEEIIGQDDTTLFSPETAQRIMETDRLVMESGETTTQEGANVAAGVTRTYQATRGPLRDRTGSVIGVVGISRDVTEQKRAELAVQHIMEGANCLLWQAEVEEIGDGRLRCDLQLASEQAAQRFLPLHLSEGQEYQDAWRLSRPLEDRERADLYSAQEIRAGRSYQQEFRCHSKDGTLRWLLENVRVEVIGEGKWRCIGVCTDITERKLAEEAAHAMTRGAQCLLWSAFVEEQPHGLQWYIETPDEEAAQEFFPIVQLPGQSYTGAWARSRMPADSAVMDARDTEALRGGRKDYTNQFRCRRADGEWRWLHETVRIEALTPGRWHCVGVCTDVTEQKRTEEELEARVGRRTAKIMEVNAQLVMAKQEADRANHAKSEFLSRMSHELRTPLNAILGFGQILEKQPLTPLQEESIHYILKGGQHLLSLINEILDIARVESGHIELSLEPISIAEIVSESCALVRPLAAENSIHLDVSDTMLGGSYVLADRQRLKQVLINLLSNAIKYNHPGGQVRVYCLPPSNDRLRLAVQDTGPGMTSEEQQRLFTPFERLNAARSGIEGTGLGLAVAQRLVDAMGGSLTLESLPDKGTTFFIDLPQAYKEITI